MAENPRANYAEIPGTLRGSAQESPGKRGIVPVQEYLPAGTALDFFIVLIYSKCGICQMIKSQSNCFVLN